LFIEITEGLSEYYFIIMAGERILREVL